jgi:hypothetical protein
MGGYNFEECVWAVTGQEVWRIKTNQELRNYKKPMVDIERRGLEWLGHMIRMAQTRDATECIKLRN